jgi:hypothetical protein
MKNEKIEKFAHVCYDCQRELTVAEVVEGQQALEKAVKQYDEFEGWFHCRGPKEMFLQAGDTELKTAMEKACIDYFEDYIIVCADCVKDMFYSETGKELKVNEQ